MKIGEVAKRAEIGIETIRYYERQGLLAEPQRRPSGYRQYDESVVHRLQFIRRTKDLGFTLAEIKDLLDLRFDTTTRCEHIQHRAGLKIADIEEKIRSLQKMKRSLKKIISGCEGKDSIKDCPLLEGIEEPHHEAGSTARKRI